MSARPLSDLQRRTLRYLAEVDFHAAEPPATIAHALGLQGPRRSGRFNRGKGNWTGRMNAAQRLISPLNGLKRRGYVDFGWRGDGLSGTAYYITAEGLAALERGE